MKKKYMILILFVFSKITYCMNNRIATTPLIIGKIVNTTDNLITIKFGSNSFTVPTKETININTGPEGFADNNELHSNFKILRNNKPYLTLFFACNIEYKNPEITIRKGTKKIYNEFPSGSFSDLIVDLKLTKNHFLVHYTKKILQAKHSNHLSKVCSKKVKK